ncbi:purine-nucleoside phosphorylase [Nesterenkonia halotolerans]|uniref:Purine nucleoside phosphorylase n=2 Tax=Nesterenkonia halotolerans TaxID=225325 RepID=A0ABR9JA29_9MICC|nr:purine-nucleoside phosphorylase [Nesterenkonia halotolerans]
MSDDISQTQPIAQTGEHMVAHPELTPTNDPTAPANLLAEEAARSLLHQVGVDSIDLACTLGSGWGEAAAQLGELVAEVDAQDVPGFHSSGVSGHSGTLKVIRTDSGAHVLVIGARTHYYEGRGVDAVAHGVRTAAAAGAKTMVLTNGCGGLNPQWAPGTPVLISDHLNLTGTSSLRGAHFVDMTDLYSSRLRGLAREIDPELPQGVYAQFPGPHYETPAEVAMAGTMGADLVGMSTALEAIAARAAGMEVFGISLVTNQAAGISPEALSHHEVLEAGREAAPRISSLLAKIIGRVLSP